MSYFPPEDSESRHSNMDDWSNYTYCPSQSTPTAQATPRQDNEMGDVHSASYTWPVSGSSTQDPYPSSQSMAWPAESSRGFALDSLQTPTQAMFDVSSLSSFDISASWPGQTELSLPSTTYPECTKYESTQDQCYPVSAPVSSSTGWEPSQSDATSFASAYDTSPVQSDYSAGSHPSAVEHSPYAHSDGCYHTNSPPMIKLEDDQTRSRLHSVPGLSSLDQPSHVNPGDVYTTPPSTAYGQTSLSTMQAPAKFEYEDVKPVPHPDRSHIHRAVSLEDARVAGHETRSKRGYTTQANSTCHCDKCGKLFQRMYNLKAHMETHNEHRHQPHSCLYPGCKRRFVRRTDLIRHEQSVHIKARNFNCPLCYSSFARKDTLRRHIDDGCPKRPETTAKIEEH